MKKNKGITLVALVITIIILIILAGITLSLVLGNEGLIAKAKKGGNDYKLAATQEQNTLATINSQFDGIITESGTSTVPIAKNGSKIINWTEDSNTDFHATNVKSSITSIEFVDLKEVNGPVEINNTNVWDVSKEQDNSVIAWIDNGKLYIGGEDGVKANEDSSFMFYDFPNVTSITFGNNFNTSDATNMSWMFANSIKLESLDLRCFNTANVTDMKYMFGGRKTDMTQNKMALREINTSSFNTSNVTDMSYMFLNCGELIILDLSNFDTSKVVNINSMFNGPNDYSSKIKSIKLGNNWDTSKVKNMNGMFCDCSNLETIIVSREFSFESVTDSAQMFECSTKIVGGNGTNYSSSYLDKTYARIDKKNQKGYFTDARTHLQSSITELEYITSDGNQYILTGIIPSNTIGTYVKLANHLTTSDLVMFGSRKSQNTRFWIGNDYDGIYFGFNTNTPKENRVVITKDEIITIELNYMNSRTSKYNNTVVDNLTSELSKENNVPIAIFAGNDNGTISYKSQISIYEIKFSDGTEIIHDFIPAYNSIVDDYGLYDKVKHKFYGNNGMGNFTGGNVKN